MAVGQLHDGRRGADAFGHHRHLGQHVLEPAAEAELLADVAVAAPRAHARHDQVAETGEARERRRLAAHGHAEARELGQAARDDRGPAVVAHVDALGHARGDGNHVLERAAELAPDDVVVEVDAEHPPP